VAPTACTTTAKGPTRGAAIALTSDDKTVVAVNRDAGSVTVMSVDYADGLPKLTVVKELPVGSAGSEPWQVVIDGCDATAYVVLRKDQAVVEIDGIGTATPTVGRSVSVGSEPTGLALTPNNTKLYVSSWVDGTLTVVDPSGMATTSVIDLNKTIAATGFLGPDVKSAPRPALAHPRAVAVTNNGDGSDADETVYVTEWFAVRTAPEDAANLAKSDTNWKGLLYKVPVATGTATTIDLPPIADTGFNDAKGNKTGCFPNQIGSVTIDGGFAYVTSTCASPLGPTGVFQKSACAFDAQCNAANGSTAAGAAGSCVNGACKGACTVDADCGAGSKANACNVAGGNVCAADTENAKTTTHPALTIVDLAAGTGTTQNLDATFTSTTLTVSKTASTRMPLLPTDVDFRPGFGYVAAEGADALFRLTIANGAITAAGSMNNDFIDLRTSADATIRLPVGVAISKNKGFAFVADEGTRDVTAVDLNNQAVAVTSGMTDFRVQSASPLPTDATKLSALKGKRFFVTGLGRWSLAGAAWGSCAACHVDGLTDNVTWYFARGPRQTVSLDGTFASSDPTDQRLLNWTAIFDEVPDFEGNVRGISGGVGALVSTVSTPPAASDRINLFTSSPQQQGLQGSTTVVANTSAVHDWLDLTTYIQNIRSPRAPTNLASADVAAGKAIFSDPAQGNCVGCHSGAKWTISKLFYTPGNTPNDDDTGGAVPGAKSLSAESWNKPVAGFPAALFPSTTAGKQTMRSGLPAGLEQIQCILRPVGTIVAGGAVPMGVSPAAVNVLELRQDMVTGGQGAGGTSANDFTAGFNPPSLLGTQVGAPYFHAGNARSLEEALSSTFLGHHQSAIAAVFNPSAAQVKQLVAYLLSIDESTTPFAIPAAGNTGGDLCAYAP
jgi:DNA-binding beta-propeller fold protein YncE